MKRVSRSELGLLGMRSVHFAIRSFAFALFIWEIYLVSGNLLQTHFSLIVPAEIVTAHFLISTILLIFLWSLPTLEPILIFFDCITALCLLYLYKGDISFAAPFFLATFTAGLISWSVAFWVAFITSFLYLGMNMYLHGVYEGFFSHPSWLLVLLPNVAISSLGLLRAYLVRYIKKMDSLVSLIQAGQQLGSTITYESLFELTSRIAKSLFGGKTCAIYLKDEEEMLKLKHIDSPYPTLFRDFSPKGTHSVLNDVFHDKSARYFPDIRGLRDEQVLPKISKIGSGMAAPFLFEEDSLGILFVAGSSEEMYDEEALRLFSIFANQTAVSLRNLQLHEKTTVMAITDAVSGVFTRGYMQDALDKEFHRSKYAKLPLSVLILDVDNFKTVNDSYGHPQGDVVLREVAKVIKSLTRTTDTVCRYGGDEFILILPETNRFGAVLVAERIRQTIEKYEFVSGSHVIKLAVSGGVSSFPEAVETKKELIESADQALYDAKNQGKNKICFGAGASLKPSRV